ncbi:MBL fold metallo-hydrolase [Halorussus aquaticus]|uniref:MBL fold metallo-hydrolase n=1 Tax=Halorussus aquaticus TaxID=2953748 RepID=A0ABD5PZQ3_9EURY|nr:MBL fold metallo-hydrolase [Halorussus aquaticus]
MTDENDDGHSLSADEVHDRIRRGERVNLLDVRNREEFEAWHITGDGVETVQVPYAEFVAAKARDEVAEFVADLDLREPVVAVCPRGEASATVADILRETGIDARNLAEGMQGWARVYVSRELSTDSEGFEGATVLQYDRPATGCLSYLVVSGDEAVVVDPLRAFADRYVADAAERGADLRWAVDTHVHADHLSGVRALAAETDAEAVLPAGATERGLTFDATLLGDGDEIRVGDAALTALHAPGHTTELTALRLGDLLFSGDALFADSFGRPDLERGDEGARDLAGTLYETLTERLLALPDDTLVAPGHRTPDADPNPDEGDCYAARVGEIRDRLRIPGERDAFVERVLDSFPPRPANYEDIVAANLGRKSLDDGDAFEIELGPNNCAVEAEGD